LFGGDCKCESSSLIGKVTKATKVKAKATRIVQKLQRNDGQSAEYTNTTTKK
jgi:hypothetical protein